MTPDVPPATTLDAALERAGIALPADQRRQLADYCARLWDWNEKLNLTRHTTFDLFVDRDVVDALRVAEALEPIEQRVLDVGSGGGVPGIILAIMRPELDVTLSESMAKKARVLEDIVQGMRLPAHVYHGRAEQLLGEDYFDVLTIRAVAPLVKLCRWFAPHWGAMRRMLVIKGPAWVDERREAREAGVMQDLELRRVAEWPLPGTESQSVLLELRPRAEDER